MKKLKELIAFTEKKNKKAVIAGSEDEHVLLAVQDATDKKIITPIFVGDKNKTEKIAKNIGFKIDSFKFVNADSENDVAKKAIELMHNNEADILVKGFINTALLLKQVLNKDYNLNMGKILSHIGCMEIPDYQKLLFITDAALNIDPDLDQKANIIQNAINVANKLGYEVPKVALLSSNEKISLKMSSSMDAAVLSTMASRGQFGKAIVDGPLALDIAISKKALDIKKIESPVNGDADILVVPHIDVGNALFKSLIYFSKAEVAGVIVGSRKPVVVTSRSDTALSKFYSITLATFLTE